MYRQFKWLKSCGFFSDFKWDQKLPDFERINVIYGPNGTGKTSLANALDNARTSQNDPPGYTRLSAIIDGNIRTATEGHDNPIFKRTFVFSEAFVHRAHNFSAAEADMPAILTVGERSADAERRLKQLHEELDTKTKAYETQCQNAKTAKKRIDDTYRNISEKVVDAASKAGGRWQSKAKYNIKTVRKAFEESHADWHELDQRELKRSIAIINSSNLKEIPETRVCIAPNESLIPRLTGAFKSRPYACCC